VTPANPAIAPLATTTTPGGKPPLPIDAATSQVRDETHPPICVDTTVDVARLPVLRADPALKPNHPVEAIRACARVSSKQHYGDTDKMEGGVQRPNIERISSVEEVVCKLRWGMVQTDQ
jgi:hypothetical protein